MLLVNTGSVILIVIVCIILFLMILTGLCVRIVPQAQAYVIEKLGSYHTTWKAGVHFMIPVLHRIAKKISLKEQVKDYEPQPVITLDNVTMQIDTVVFYEVTDPKLFTYGVENPGYALEKLTATTLRNIIGSIELDSTLTSRDLINAKMVEILDIATDPWGIKVSRVELKNILPPKDIREAMEKQMRAERERREVILQAEGIKQSQILQAEGIKQAQILKAEGDKQSAILQSEGQAEAILKVKEAEAKGIELIKKSGADKAVLTLKAYEALVDVANGQATKLIIPSELQSMAGLVSSISEIAKTEKK